MKKILFLILFVGFLIFNNDAYSRAGGGGSKRSSSSSSSSSSGLSSLSRSAGARGIGGFSWLAILGFGGVAIVIYIIYRMNKKKIDAVIGTVSGDGDSDDYSGRSMLSDAPLNPLFVAANPDFTTDGFKSKVQIAFPAIQDAWMNQHLGKVRKWISDGVYQRFHIQFEMMKKLGQKNIVANVVVDDVKIVSSNIQNDFSVITVAVYFTMDDKFISEKIKGLDEEMDGDQAMEYWTFVKKSGATKGDLFTNNNCPNCGDVLNEDGGEVSKCGSCGTVTYLGDYDWVLSEITQEDDYQENYMAADATALEVLSHDGLSIQSMEDKASNAFVHYLLALSSANTKFFGKFATEELMETVKQQFDKPFLFNRIYINTVDYQTYFKDETHNHMIVAVKYSAQRVKLDEKDKVEFVDSEITSHYKSLTLSKKLGGEVSKAKIWSHDCPSCGAPYADTSALTCSFCGDKINSTDKEWIITGIA